MNSYHIEYKLEHEYYISNLEGNGKELHSICFAWIEVHVLIYVKNAWKSCKLGL
jgi:hypothetical protein